VECPISWGIRATCWFTKPVTTNVEHFSLLQSHVANIEETELARQQMIEEQKQKYT